MNNNFNRQFVLLDFQLLDDKAFLKFVGSSEFATYLVLRRHVWRGMEPHYMGLHEIYLKERKLVCSLERDKLAEITGIVRQNVSTFLTKLEKRGVIRRIRTGRQNIYVLGEWVDVKGDGSQRVEWFYLDGVFGIEKSEVAKTTSSGVVKSRHQTSDAVRLHGDHNNREENREENNTVNGKKNLFEKVPNLDQPPEKEDYIAQVILDQLGDKHSSSFYKLVAAKVPEYIIREALAEIKADGAKNPAKVFTHRMKLYAFDQVKRQIGS
jgi:hypothetical protein